MQGRHHVHVETVGKLLASGSDGTLTVVTEAV